MMAVVLEQLKIIQQLATQVMGKSVESLEYNEFDRCLVLWDEFSHKIASGQTYRLTEYEGKLHDEFVVVECTKNADSWIPESHNDIEYFEMNKHANPQD